MAWGMGGPQCQPAGPYGLSPTDVGHMTNHMTNHMTSCMHPMSSNGFMNVHAYNQGGGIGNFAAATNHATAAAALAMNTHHHIAARDGAATAAGFVDPELRTSSIAALRLKAREHSAAMGILTAQAYNIK